MFFPSLWFYILLLGEIVSLLLVFLFCSDTSSLAKITFWVCTFGSNPLGMSFRWSKTPFLKVNVETHFVFYINFIRQVYTFLSFVYLDPLLFYFVLFCNVLCSWSFGEIFFLLNSKILIWLCSNPIIFVLFASKLFFFCLNVVHVQLLDFSGFNWINFVCNLHCCNCREIPVSFVLESYFGLFCLKKFSSFFSSV